MIRKECMYLWLLLKTSQDCLSNLNVIEYTKQQLNWEYENIDVDISKYTSFEKETHQYVVNDFIFDTVIASKIKNNRLQLIIIIC